MVYIILFFSKYSYNLLAYSEITFKKITGDVVGDKTTMKRRKSYFKIISYLL